MDFDPLELIGGALGRSVYELLRQRLLKVVPVAAPGAGAEWSTVVPSGVTWELLGVIESLTTSAVVASRLPSVRIFDENSNTIQRFPSALNPAASTTSPEMWTSGYGDHNGNSGGHAALPDPPLPLLAGWSIRSVTAALDVGDAYSNIFVLVREWSIAQVQSNLDWLLETLRR